MDDDHKNLFPVCVTAPIPLEIIETFLKEADHGVKSASHSLPRLFTVISSLSDSHDAFEGSWPPLSQAFTSPFLNKSVAQISLALRKKAKNDASQFDPNLFTILDEKTPVDQKVLLCARNQRGAVESCRVPFNEAVTLNTIQAGCTDLSEQQSILEHETKSQGRPSRKRLPRKSKTAATARMTPNKSTSSRHQKTLSTGHKPGEILGRRFRDSKGNIITLLGKLGSTRVIGSTTFSPDTGEETKIVEELEPILRRRTTSGLKSGKS